MTQTCLAAVLAMACLNACSGGPANAPAAAAQTTAPAASMAAAEPVTAAPPAGTIAGTVAETMNSGGYTYARLQTGQTDVWIAASEFPVKTGERLTVAFEMPMENFHSTTLNRDFPLIYFATAVAREGETLAAAAGQAGAPAMVGSHDSAHVVEPIAPVPGGLSIADVWAQRASLAGKPVVVRGKVVKVNNGIMDRNWLHLQDGSGSAAARTNDLTVTTAAEVKVGDTVTVSGILAIEKDFGAGYAYDAILETATVTGK